MTTIASVDADTHARSAAGRYLTFSLHDEVYALDIMKITEIIEFRPLTVVPMMPAFIRGVINLRGRVLPVVDLAARFGQGSTEVARRTGILVVEAHEVVAAEHLEDVAHALGGQAGPQGPEGHETQALQGIGIMVDAVNKVVQLGDEDIAPPPSFGAGIRASFISGMARLDGEFAVVLDIDRVLTMQDATAATGTPPPGADR